MDELTTPPVNKVNTDATGFMTQRVLSHMFLYMTLFPFKDKYIFNAHIMSILLNIHV